MAPKRPNYINVLPDEVLCMVFDFLDLQSVKNASRTCRRWNNIIFHSGYVARFQFVMDPIRADCSRSWEELMKLQARHTKRRYRTFVVSVRNGTENAHVNVWDFIYPKITTNIRQLLVLFRNAQKRDMLPKIIAALPSMSQLQVLVVEDVPKLDLSQEFIQDNIPTIRSKSLELLHMRCSYKHTIEIPKLKVYRGALSALIPPEGSSEMALFANIKHVEVSVKSWKTVDPAIFSHMPCLEAVDWVAPLEADIVIAMTEMCPSLISFYLYKELSSSDVFFVKHLLKCTQLRSLGFRLSIEEDLFLDFSKLIHLEELFLRCCELIPFSLLSLPKSLTRLWVSVVPKYERSLMGIISCRLTQLKKLCITYHEAVVSKDVLKALPCLKQLESLRFDLCQLTQSFLPGIDAPMHRLRTVHLVRCKLEMKHLLGLQEKFPNLKQLELKECFVPTESGYCSSVNRIFYPPFNFF